MRPTEYTDQQIIEAGEQLLAEGRNVTGFALRKIVGGGNPTRLKSIWDAHAAGSSPAEVEPVAELPNEVAEALKELTNGLSDQINRLAVDLNDKAVKASERRVSEVIKAASLERETSEREMADATATVNDLEEKLDEAQAEIGDLTATVEDTRAALAETKTALARAEEKQAQAEKTAADQQVEIRGLNDQIKALAEQLAERDRTIAILQHDATRHADEVQALTVQIDDLKTDLAAEKQFSEEAGKNLLKKDTETRELRARLDSAARELDKAEQRAERLQQQWIEAGKAAAQASKKTPAKKPTTPRKPAAKKATPAPKPEAQEQDEPFTDAKAQLDAWSAQSAGQENEEGGNE
jgi:chromosome segregation ATPase